MTAPNLLVLLHSPLLDSQTWARVQPLLPTPAVVPDLRTQPDEASPTRRHVEAVVQAVRSAGGRRVAVISHSGAGMLAGPVVDELNDAVVRLVFVDAMLPRPGASRFDLIAWESDADTAARLRAHLDAGGIFPQWGDRTWARLVEDEGLRAQLRPTLTPLGAAYWDESVEHSDAWERLPGLYIRCTDTYAPYADVARGLGWEVVELPGSHLAPVTAPEQIADAVGRWACST